MPRKVGGVRNTHLGVGRTGYGISFRTHFAQQAGLAPVESRWA
jgi:hypothetical protein